MKKITLLLAIISIAFISCKEDVTKKIKQANLDKAKVANKVNKEDAPVITFEEVEHDFGDINEGDKVENVFKFKNTGKSELIITQIKSTCGCTVPSDWDRKPLKPGESGQFTVKFNSANKPNKQQKTVIVTCNTFKGRETVKIKANVKADPEKEQKRKESAAKRKKIREEKAAKKAAEVALKAKELNKAKK